MITQEKKDQYIAMIHKEMERRGFEPDEIPRIIAKTGFMRVMEEYAEEQMHDSIEDTVDDIIMTAARS